MRMIMLVVFAGCALFSLLTAGLTFSSGQPGSAVFFGLFGLFFGALAAAVRKQDAVDSGSQRPGFVPHWYVVTALLVTGLLVVGSILWRLVR